MRKIALIGGDSRQIHTAETLKSAGFLPFVYGNDGAAAAGFTAPYTMEETLKGASAVLLPIPSVKKKGFFYAPQTENAPCIEAFLQALPPEATVLLWQREKCPFHLSNRVVDLAEDEILLKENARITAEAALTLAIQETHRCFSELRVAVLGYGRIGKILCDRLKALSAEVTVIARRPESRALAQRVADKVRSPEEPRLFADVDLIFNTVPVPILTEENFKDTPKTTPYLELASLPGGISPEAIVKSPCRIVQCQGLPGRLAPRSAGKALAQAVLRHLEGQT